MKLRPDLYLYTVFPDPGTHNPFVRANLAPHLLMIAGGTGLTPMYQIVKSSLKDPNDRTKLCLIYANIEEDDICELPLRIFSLPARRRPSK